MKLFPLKKSILSLMIISFASCSSVKTATVSGKVSAIQKGKDGYTATIENSKGQIYYGTISIPNLGNPELFKQAEIGDAIIVKGEVWKMGKEKQITVREIIELNKKNDAGTKITGIVETIEKGKDGYTAKIKTAEGTTYFATISIPNLGSAEKYRQFKIGENVSLSGEVWKMGDDNRITVRKIID
ncbi:OB-fold nucleic acid binding domain-containing protein [Flavobacterium sp. XS2P39]|uniref:OB-fold nucleic acid binding domain-containing protein n=1 Tax=Flavobacterium sp. XS2P39 TaxID=3401725 RepID=UPI003AAD8767